ncbi:RHS repeat-associated core domain-containing protein [Maridesulfovibrio sp.]|uniref:RHS repeat-associated core domain-containing protein n=1 Tax=Maridesulfovibrio sp. TaxID=2795000 RepID=UPI002A1894AE|nr:RHS repeat-associated core domain-containing protein [Maridesulfovibrio sp.]
MKSFTNYRMELRPRSELTTGLVLYGETEPAEMQIENLWKIVDRRTGEELKEPRVDFSEFSMGDKLYSSMMKPETKRRWDQKLYEQEQSKAIFAKLKRMVHAQFMEQNPNLPVVRGLAETDYGRKAVAEFSAATASVNHQHSQHPLHPYVQAGTGESIQDELAKDGIEIDPDEKVRTIAFTVPGADKPFSILAAARDEKWRIFERLLAFDPNDLHLQYGYDAGGRLNKVWEGDRLVEQYQYGAQGERLVSETLHSGRRHYEYDDKLRLLQAGDTTYTYNAYGSLSEKKVKNRVTQYEYLSNGQLCKVVLPDGRIIKYVFDKRGVRIAKKINGEIVEKYKWKDFKTIEAIADGTGKNKITFTHDEESDQIIMTSEGKTFYLAVDQVGSVFMVADDQGNEIKRIIYDSFGNVLVDTNEQFYLPLGFASGLTDKDTGLVHFGFREYDSEIGRFTAQDPLGYGGGDVDVYGYCLDDPINFNDPDGLMTGGVGPIDFPPERTVLGIFYRWQASDGACAECKKLDGEYFDTPAVKRPHPNCRCRLIECVVWEEVTKWEKVRETDIYYEYIRAFIVGSGGSAYWRKYYTAEEQRTKRRVRECEDSKTELLNKTETRQVDETDVVETDVTVICQGRNIEHGDFVFTYHPGTGKTVVLSNN